MLGKVPVQLRADDADRNLRVHHDAPRGSLGSESFPRGKHVEEGAGTGGQEGAAGCGTHKAIPPYQVN